MARRMSGGLIGTRDGASLPAGSALMASLLGLAGGAWLVSARLATPDMRLGVLTGPPMMPEHDQTGMAGSMSMGLGAFIATWTVMMVAMMIPSMLPAARAFCTWARATRQPSGAPVLMIAGYLLVWGAIGGAAYLVVQALQDWLTAGSVTALRVGAALLVVAGAYQLTPPKQACLRHCRSGVSRRVGEGYLGALRAGLWQGVYCLGSSWPLMLVLLLVGMMNLAWMGLIAATIFVEKVLPGGHVASKVAGWGLAACGIVLLAAPHTLPALS